MAHIVNPHNLDIDDDAVFAGALSQGLIWIEDGDDSGHTSIVEDVYTDYDIDDVLYETQEFIQSQSEKWVNFTRISHHIHKLFPDLKSKKFVHTGKRYKSFVQLIKDFPEQFKLRQDKQKQGLFWICILPKQISSPSTGAIFSEIYSFIEGRRHEDWVNFAKVSHHIRKTFPKINLKQIGLQDKSYKNLREVTEDYPQYFTLRADTDKRGLFYIRIAEKDY